MLFDEDKHKNKSTTYDLLYNKDWTLAANNNSVTIELTKTMQDNGGDNKFQELLAQVFLYDTEQIVKSEIIEVNKTDFSIPKPEGISLVTINAPEVKENNQEKLIIFPLLVKPKNDKINKWGDKKGRYWAAGQGKNMTTFNSGRNGGKRKHAGRDLYTEPLETVVAIADGEVLEVRSFYAYTDQVTIRHTLKDGRDFIIRYGELDPSSISVKKGDKVTQKQKIGETGKLLTLDKSKLVPLMSLDNEAVFMIHFEHYSGSKGFDLDNNPLSNSSNPYMRRSDLVDSLAILEEGYRNSFNTAVKKGDNAKCPKCGKTECRETWDTHTNNRILKLHPNIECIARRFINEVEDTYNMQIRITATYRTYAEQNAEYSKGRRGLKGEATVTKAKGGESYHNFGLAIDVVEITKDKKANFSIDITRKIAPIAKKYGFAWGGDWTGNFKDYPHFDKTYEKTTSDLRKLLSQYGDYKKIPL